MELHEAQLFRALSHCFGEDRVLFRLCASMVCRSSLRGRVEDESAVNWELLSSLLFTIIDHDGDPHLVVEFDVEHGNVIDVNALERKEILGPLLTRIGVRYLVISRDELCEMLDPASELTLATLLLSKIETPSLVDEA